MTTCAKCLELGSLCIQHDVLPNPFELLKDIQAQRAKLEERISYLIKTFNICWACQKAYAMSPDDVCGDCFLSFKEEYYG